MQQGRALFQCRFAMDPKMRNASKNNLKTVSLSID